MAETNGGTSPTRNYIVLDQQHFEDDQQPYFQIVHNVTARNASNALRRAFRELREKGLDATEATLVVIPESMWRPTVVKATVREQVSVSVG